MPASPVMVRALRDPLITGENLDGTIATVERMKEKLIGMDRVTWRQSIP